MTLGEVAAWGSGGTPKRSVSEYFGEGVPWLSISDLNDAVVQDAKESLTQSGVENSSAKIVPPGTLFVAMYGSIGKLGVAGREMCTSQAIAFAKPNPDLVDLRYLFHYLLSQRPALQARGRGGTQANIGQGDLKAWPMPLPPLDEQRRIAAILDHADALRAKRRQVLAHLDDLTQSIYAASLRGVPLERVTAGELMPIMRNGVSPASSGECESMVLTLSAITGPRFDPSAVKQGLFSTEPPAEKRVTAQDFLMCRGNGNRDLVGVGTYSPEDREDLVFPDTVVAGRVNTSKVLMEILELAWRQAPVRRQVEAAARTTNGTFKVNQRSLSAIHLQVPPMEVQKEVVHRVAHLRSQAARVGCALASLDELFASLQSGAFKGEL